ncbi:type II toxin-antitoxin system PemK/MazF family toxin [Helicobacter cetorum]|uniref:type II toxin-antitoxin system PemK/MazF family toxin n=1 Tax=Helicobacter cetorum TaxID=138563 RepID=UPI000CF170A4|nr:type II toxin-antitoxin system PemK/MazF family toxin [Helicobacter cetorum]
MQVLEDGFSKSQGQIWIVELGNSNCKGHEQRGSRPFYIISCNTYNEKSKTYIGFFMSTSSKKEQNIFAYQVRGIEGHVNVSQIRTLDDERFIKYVGKSSKEELRKILKCFKENILKVDF